jgi:hypothetical protein
MTASLTEQLDGEAIELAGWDEAWLHEARGYHGKWIKAGSGTDRYTMPDHSRLVLGHGAYSEPGNHPFFRAHPVSAANVMRAYDQTSPAERAQGARWYADAHDLAAKMADGDARKGAILLASYSPQASWPVNMFNAARAAKEHRALGPGDGLITGDMQQNAQEGLDGLSVDQAMTSPKTRAFARLIELGGDAPGDGAGEVVIDRHALSVAVGETLGKKDASKAPIGSPRYHEYIADAYRQAAISISKRDGVTMTPYQLQAITWLHQQAVTQASDAATGTVGNAARGGKALAKGRMTMTANAWKRWMLYAQAGGLPAVPGTTSLAAQITEMLAEQSIGGQIELAFNPAQPRDTHGKWTRLSGVGDAADVAMKEREGFSVSPRTGRSPEDGYMVARTGHTHTLPAPILDDHAKLTRAIDSMLMAEKPAFAGQQTYLGGWVHDGKLWLEPSDNFARMGEAVAAGRERNQIAIWDVAGLQEIDTGGSGGGRITEHDASGRPVRSYSEGPPGSAAGLSRPAGARAAGDSQPAGFPDSIGHQIELAGHRPGHHHHPPAGDLIAG